MSDVIRTGAEPAIAAGLNRFTAVDWGAILAGVAVATAISFVMAAFGSGVGLSLASPYEGASPMTHAIALALWVLWVTVASYAAGGYVCGRLRRRAVDVPHEEVEARDGAHGLVVWATAMIIVAYAAGSSIYSLGKAGVDTAAQQAQKSGLATNPVDYRVDRLMRGAAPAGPGGVSAPASAQGGAQGGAQGAAQNQAETRQIASRIVARGQATGEVNEEDRSFLASTLAGAGMGQADARARVDALAQQVKEDNARAKELAEKARKAGVVASFIAAAAMLLAAASAWGGATLGGRHRDENLGFSALTRW
ncbi:MAG: hypothetical protein CTY15_00290 [Methylocystis sp.]|nr:MAG: hypothetical protein CTY15_00290 [Methylocystis sp.]